MTTDSPAAPAAPGTGPEPMIAAALGAIGRDFHDAVLIAADAEGAADVSGLADQLAVLHGAVEHAIRKVSALVETPEGAAAEGAAAVALDSAASRAELRAALLPGLLDRLVTGVWAWESAQPAAAPS